MPALSIEEAERLREQVREGYGRIADGATPARDKNEAEGGSPEGGCCACGCAPEGGGEAAGSATALAQQIGYDDDQLAALPEGANLGLSCGNPTAIAALRPGETVLDLGSGAGFDCFLAGPKVGPGGRVIGVDMTPAMLGKARRLLVDYQNRSGFDNVEFRLGEIEALPVADASVDVVISNCVINLSADKPRVWAEVARVLRPGGRVSVSDVALLRPLPEAVAQMIESWVGCVAGAVSLGEYETMVRGAGLNDVTLTPRPKFIAALEHAQDPLYRRIVEHLPAGASLGEYITSLDVTARKADHEPVGRS